MAAITQLLYFFHQVHADTHGLLECTLRDRPLLPLKVTLLAHPRDWAPTRDKAQLMLLVQGV